jgi:Cof subfamily protein (haloacid dehalogenase superfamily)
MEVESSFVWANKPYPRRVRLLALDVDGTVLTSDHKVAAPTRKVLQIAVEHGIVVVLASSRSPAGLRPVLAQLGIDTPMIAYQGALVCRPVHNHNLEVLAEKRMPRQQVRTVLREALKRGLSVGWYAGNEWIVPRVDAAILREAKIVGEKPLVDTDMASRDEKPHKLLCIASGRRWLSALEELSARLPDPLVGRFSHENYLEITHREADKALALLGLCRRLGFSPAEVAAIGDGENDIGMLRAAGLGVAMGHSPPSVRAAADWVTDTNDQNGVAVAVRRMLA